MALSPATSVGGAGGGAVELLAEDLLSGAAAFDFASIANSYAHLRLVMQLRTTENSGAIALVTINGDGGANYYHSRLNNTNATLSGNAGVGTTTGQLVPAALPGATDTAGRAAALDVTFLHYAATTFHKEWLCLYHSSVSAALAGQAVGMSGGTWASTAAIARIQVAPSVGTTFAAGSVAYLYGIS